VTPEQDRGSSGHPAPRSHWLDRERVLLYPCLSFLAAFVILLGARTAFSLLGRIDPAANPVGNDFLGFWSAARLAVEGRPEAAYNEAAIQAMHQVAVPGFTKLVLVWRYPPTYLLAVWPLGLMPYLPALGVFLAATVAFWAALIRRMFADPRAWVVAAALPAGLWNFSNGQNGFLTAGLAGFAMLALDRRPVLAGVLVGLLAIKPHLAVLFPIALLADRRWRTIAAAAATAVGFTAVSVAVFGWPTFDAFLDNVATARQSIDNREVRLELIPTPYASGLSFGLSPEAAMLLQIVVAAGAAGCVWAVWRVRQVPPEAKFATLAAGSLLVSPYLFFYDLTWIGLALAWLAKLGMRCGFGTGERELLAAAFIGSGLVPEAYAITGVQLGWALPLALTVAATWRALRPPA
jgi:Glycosyltransferase family 87